MTDGVAQGQTKAYVERILRMKEEARAIKDDIREIYAEARDNGFDKTVLGQIVSYIEKRAKGASEMDEREAMFDLYLAAYYGEGGFSHVHTRARTRDGEITADVGNPISDEPAPRVGKSDGADTGEGAARPVLPEPLSPSMANEKVGGFSVPAAPWSRGGTDARPESETMRAANVGQPDATAGETAPHSATLPRERGEAKEVRSSPPGSDEPAPRPMAPAGVQEVSRDVAVTAWAFQPKSHDGPHSSDGLARMPGCQHLDACAGMWNRRGVTCEKAWAAQHAEAAQ